MKPMSLDGHPVSGGKINIPIQFEMPASQADAGTAAEAGPPPAPKALELARQIAASTYGPDQMQAVRARVKESMDQRFRSESLTEQEQAALDDYLAALDASGPARAEAYAEVIARHFTEQQLVEIAAFVGSPTGQAWTRGGADLSAASAQAAARLDEDMMSDTKKRFCGKYECLQPAAAAPASRAKP